MEYKHCNESTHRTETEKKYLETRLKTIEVQVRALPKLLLKINTVMIF